MATRLESSYMTCKYLPGTHALPAPSERRATAWLARMLGERAVKRLAGGWRLASGGWPLASGLWPPASGRAAGPVVG